MVGQDALGEYFEAQLQQAGVEVFVDEDNLAHTGTVMVSLVTEFDAATHLEETPVIRLSSADASLPHWTHA